MNKAITGANVRSIGVEEIAHSIVVLSQEVPCTIDARKSSEKKARKRKHKKMFAQEILMTEPNILLFLMFIVKLRHLFVK